MKQKKQSLRQSRQERDKGCHKRTEKAEQARKETGKVRAEGEKTTAKE